MVISVAHDAKARYAKLASWLVRDENAFKHDTLGPLSLSAEL